jgi:hypothetical protein
MKSNTETSRRKRRIPAAAAGQPDTLHSSRKKHRHLTLRAGHQALYVEGPMLCLVQVRAVCVTPQGLHVDLLGLKTLASRRPPFADGVHWEIFSVWDYVTIQPDLWHSSVVGWQVCFNRSLIASISDFCANLPAHLPAEVRWKRAGAFLASLLPDD